MEFIAAIIGEGAESKKAPKAIRCISVLLLTGLIIGLGIFFAVTVPFLLAKIFGFALAAVFMIFGGYLIYKIIKTSNL